MPRLLLSAFVLSALVLPANAAAPYPARPDLPTWAKNAQGRFAYGMYIGGKKGGYTIEENKLGKFDGKDVLTVTSREYSVTLYDGEKSVKDERIVYHYELAGDGALLYAKYHSTEDGQTLTHEMKRHGKGMRITTTQGKRTQTRDMSLPRDTLAVARALEDWFGKPHKPGDTWAKYSVAWNTDDVDHVDQKETYVFKKERKANVLGRQRTVFAVDVVIEGSKLVAEVLPDGRPVIGRTGGLMTIKLEKEEDARKMTGPPPELMDVSCVFLDVDLVAARRVSELKLQLNNLGDFEVPASHRQIIEKQKDCCVVTIKRDFRVSKRVPLTDADEKAHTTATPRLQSDDKTISALAKKIVGKETGALKKSKLLARWVFETLKKSYSSGAKRSLDVLDNKAGACVEHTMLFVSLARAVGVPVREVGGLAFTKSKGRPMMGWHAWAEVYDGHQWVSIDPTWDQTYVDGTHLKLSEGDKDMTWANIAGEVKIKVLDVTKRK